MSQKGKVDCAGLTDKGRVRRHNEDQFLIGGLNKSMLVHQTSLSIDDPTRLFGGTQGHLMVVADGMGGQLGGELASSAAVDSLSQYILNTMPWFFRLGERPDDDRLDVLKDALLSCQEELRMLMTTSSGKRGMGTTLTMAYLIWPRLYVVHAGDSRCYLLRDSKLQQITTDHTFAQSMVEEGNLAAEDAEESRWSHVLWNALGGGTDHVLPDGYKATLEIGDTLLLCTDGLTRQVDDPSIARVLGEPTSAEEACRALVDRANEAGGEDNVTVIVARFQGMDEPVRPMSASAAATPDVDVRPHDSPRGPTPAGEQTQGAPAP